MSVILSPDVLARRVSNCRALHRQEKQPWVRSGEGEQPMQAAVGENESLQGFCEVPEVPSSNHFCLLQHLKELRNSKIFRL